jgi:alanyl-tRNA synthetase
MKAREIQEKFIRFFVKNNHLLIPQISLVPENDPTLLFTSAGMVALKPYFLGLEKPPHPRLVNTQRCLRTTDIDEVGKNARTLSFFEMLGSWSIGDYFKEEAIRLAWEFLTGDLGLAQEKLWASYFAGDRDYPQLPADEESAKVWQKVGISPEHLVGLGYEENFWRLGETGPCGPSTEVYFDRGPSFGCRKKTCRPGCSCDRFLEIWNAGVFMQYNRAADGKYRPLPFKSVDTGAGLERLAMVLQGRESVFETDLFANLIGEITDLSKISYGRWPKLDQAVRRVADHARASMFLIADGVLPGNQEQGYILRRLIRRAVDAADKIGFLGLDKLVPVVVSDYKQSYPYLTDQEDKIRDVLVSEENRYRDAIFRGRKKIDVIAKAGSLKLKEKARGSVVGADLGPKNVISGWEIFYFTQTFGLSPELVKKEFLSRGLALSEKVDEEFTRAQKDHQKKSQSGRKFKSGLADDSSKQVIAYHTATHLLQQALRQVLGEHVRQVGSNITDQRLRFDFTHPKAMTDSEIDQVEEIVNDKIRADLPVSYQEKSLAEAQKEGALAFFADRYRQGKVRVYGIGDFSKEVCRGPHTKRTGELGKFTIQKEESVGSGKRRIYGILEKETGN